MKFFHKFSTRSKILLGSAVALVAIAVPMLTQAALGDNRETKAYVQGIQGFDHVQFNSFTGVPNTGDERNFMTGKINNGPVGFYDPMNNVKAGDEVLVRVYVHNNADGRLNASGAGVAKNTKVRVAMPTGSNQSQAMTAFISADNAQPKVIEDALNITTPNAVALEYVPGSAAIKTSKLDNVALSDAIITDGVQIGDDALDGNLPGCFDYVALVSFRVKLKAPAYNLQKTVRVHGTPTGGWAEEVNVKPGDKVDFALDFKNSGTTTLDKVAIGDRLPVGLTYVPGSTTWVSGHTSGQWTKVTNDDWIKGGLNIGGYLPNANAIVRFTAKVADANALECGVNQLVNHGFAKPEGKDNIQDSATVKVTKQCQTVTPFYACNILTVEKGANRTVTVKDFQYTAKDGAVFKHVVIDWNDGTTTMTDAANGKTHQYAKDGTYVIRAVPYFTVPGNTQPVAAAENAACSQTVAFSTTVTTPPTELPKSGAGSIAALFAAVSIAGAFVHRLFLGRRLAS